MKKITLIWLFCLAIALTGCVDKKVENIGNVVEIENVENVVEIEDAENYEWKLDVAWIVAQISFWALPTDRTLILDWYFEDHADHLNIAEWMREKWFTENETLPGNKVKFQWKVRFLDGAAGNHYYEVISIDNIENIWYTDSTWVKDILEWWNYCETDNDCAYILWECPFGCFVPLYKDFADIAWKVLDNYFEINDKSCVYGCLYMDKVICENYKCEMTVADDSDDIHVCSPLYKDPNFEENNTELACENISNPVCANDWKTYENDCYACTSKLVETYKFWKCEDNTK